MSKWNFYDVVTVDGYSFPTEPQVNFGFNSQGIVFVVRGSHVIHYSFNGTDLHGDLDPTDQTAALTFDNRVENKVWFRAYDGYGTVRVESWGGYGNS